MPITPFVQLKLASFFFNFKLNILNHCFCKMYISHDLNNKNSQFDQEIQISQFEWDEESVSYEI